MAEKKITLKVGDKEIPFHVTTQLYNGFVNELKADDKTAPAKRFLVRALADEKQRPVIDELCDYGMHVELATALVEEFRPKLEIEVKK